MAKKYSLRKNPVAEIEIDGKPYEVQLGNVSFTTAAAGWQKKLQGIVDGSVPHDELADVFIGLAGDAHDMVASVMGEAATEELIGGPNSLNFYRIIDVVNIITDVMGSEQSKAAIAALSSVPETADED